MSQGHRTRAHLAHTTAQKGGGRQSLTVWLTGLPMLRPWCRLSPTMKVEFCNFSGYKIYPGQVRSPSLPRMAHHRHCWQGC